MGNDTTPAITRNRSVPLSFPGREVYLSWENPGVQVGYNNSFTTNTTAGPGKVSQIVQCAFLWLTSAICIVCCLDFPIEHHLYDPYRCERHNG